MDIKGYRELSATEVATINRGKDVAAFVELLVNDIAALPDADLRWVSIARTHLQQGFMALTRAVARPTNF